MHNDFFLNTFIELSFRWLVLVFAVIAWNVTPALGQDKTVRVCAMDARNEAGLQGATVTLTTDNLTISSTTGGNGCAYLTGQIPVANEDAADLPKGLITGSPYPNPASRRVTIPVYTGRPAETSFALFDVQGRQIPVSTRSSITGQARIFDVEVKDLADGLYFYRVYGEAGVASGKFIKVKAGASSNSGLSVAQPIFTAFDGHRAPAELLRADSVSIEVARDGFVAVSDKQVLSNFQTLSYSLFKVAQQRIPLIDMFGEKYLGLYTGGLYPNQQNEMPAAHLDAGLARAASIEPLDIEGNPDPQGRIVLTSIGMSTTSSIFCGVADPSEPCKAGTFMDVLEADNQINARLTVIDGADPGKTADKWEDPDMSAFDRVEEEELTPFGLSEAQVQIAWINLASSMPTAILPGRNANAYLLEQQYGNVLRALAVRYPNLKQVFFASRVYAGYATTGLNPEPFAYESGFAVKWTVEAQIEQMHVQGGLVDAEAGDLNFNAIAPWIAWGPYLWADGANPRSDGLVWLPEDLKEDGTHLNRPGIEKITAILLDFFKTSRLTRCWFIENGAACE